MSSVAHPAVTPDEARRLAASFADCLDRSEGAYTPASLEQADDSVSGYHRMPSLGLLDADMEAAGHRRGSADWVHAKKSSAAGQGTGG